MAKTHSDLETLFPLTGKPGVMLAQYVRAGSHGMAIPDAGRRAGLPYPTANRATATLVEAGLVVAGDGGGYRLNVDAPHASIAHDAVRAATGYRYRDHDRDMFRWNGDDSSLEVADTTLQPLMPDPLVRRGRTVGGAAIEVLGPSVLEARTFALEIEHTLSSTLRLLVNPHQEPYGLWHVERDRTLIHKTMHLGAGVYAGQLANSEKIRR